MAGVILSLVAIRRELLCFFFFPNRECFQSIQEQLCSVLCYILEIPSTWFYGSIRREKYSSCRPLWGVVWSLMVQDWLSPGTSVKFYASPYRIMDGTQCVLQVSVNLFRPLFTPRTPLIPYTSSDRRGSLRSSFPISSPLPGVRLRDLIYSEVATSRRDPFLRRAARQLTLALRF